MILLLIIAALVWCIPYFFQAEEFPDEIIRFTPVELDTIEQRLIHKRVQHTYAFTFEKNRRHDSFPVARQLSKKWVLDINKADSILFEQLPGIGEKLSSRIVRYRERLGGFVTLEQLKEVYGIQDSLFQQLKGQLLLSKNDVPRKLALNRADYKTLRQHPYVSHLMAKILLAYLRVHERIKDEEELININGLDKKELEKLLPYLDFN